MTTTMVRSAALTALMHVFLVSHGAQGLQPEEGASLQVLDLPWQDELCCDSPSAHLTMEGGGTHAAETNRSQLNLPRSSLCNFRSAATDSHPRRGGTCLDIRCRTDENWESFTCDLQSHSQPSVQDAALMAVSLQHLWSEDDSQLNNENISSDNPVICEAVDSFVCSVTLDTATGFVAAVTVSVSDTAAPPVLVRIPARPEKPSPPVNISHVQTIEAELILLWDVPSDFEAGPLRYEVRYSSDSTRPAWQVVSSPGERRLSLDLKPRLNHTVQVRCSGLGDPPLWSDWSELHHIYLDTVSYIPEKMVARPGENVTVYCVFNDRSVNASTAMWMLNFQQRLHRSQYHTVNQWVSRVTLRPSKTRLYDLLQCTQEWTIPYSQIYVDGAFISIRCETSGDIDAMDCSWKNTQWTKPSFHFRWADLPCDVMEERDSAGEDVGEMGPPCLQIGSRQKSCTIQPLRMNCYKLWLEVPSLLGPVRSKPVFLSPIDHVKPHTPTNVKAVSQSRGSLMVTWEPPSLPVEGLQCQFRYHSPSTARAQPDWKVQSPVRTSWAEVAVPDMCRVYVVQARCMHTNGSGYWSDWSDSVYSTPQNSRAPERGPDFWRILQENPYKNQTNVTLLFEQIPVSENSYCVDGFIVQHQALNGAVVRQRMEVVPSYSFEWNQELHTVTVEAFNSRGRSSNNINMTLESQAKRGCVHSFHVSVINSTCVSLTWSLLDNSSVPLFMVVQWFPHRQQDSGLHKGHSAETWTRRPYRDPPVYLRGDFFGSEEYGFYLYPVFADGEGESVYAKANRGHPAAHMMLISISFLSVVLVVTLVLSQNQMKRLVWKDVPNPNQCSWAKGLDFKKADNFDHPFQPAEGLQAWPLLLPSEKISKVVIVEQADLSALTSALIQPPLVSLSPHSSAALAASPGFDPKTERSHFMGSEHHDVLLIRAPTTPLNPDALTSSHSIMGGLRPIDSSADQPPGSTDSSAQSSVTYATVLLTNPKQEQHTAPPLHYKDGGGSSSSDEGNFSANNSDISGSFVCGLWELDSCRGGEMEDPRRSCSYNSVEELSETSEGEDDVKEEKKLFYLGMGYPAEDEEEELLKSVILNREEHSVESDPLLVPESLREPPELSSVSTCGSSLLYKPQFRTVQSMRQTQDSKSQL